MKFTAQRLPKYRFSSSLQHSRDSRVELLQTVFLNIFIICFMVHVILKPITLRPHEWYNFHSFQKMKRYPRPEISYRN